MVFPEKQTNDSQIWKLRGIVLNSKPDDNNNQLCSINNYIIFTYIAPYMSGNDLCLI